MEKLFFPFFCDGWTIGKVRVQRYAGKQLKGETVHVES
jgi:hypothetical protein